MSENGYDYVDCFQGEYSDKNNSIGIAQVGTAFFKSKPKWITVLMNMRNRIVKPFGLKTNGGTEDKNIKSNDLRFEEGHRFGIFKVFNKSENELIVGENDKHLDFKISVLLNPIISESGKKSLSITSAVKFNNRFGRFYFTIIKPLHKIIVPAILKGVIIELEKEN